MYQSANIVHLKNSNFGDKGEIMDRDLNRIKGRAVIVFYSPGCGYCVRLDPEYVKFAERARQQGILVFAVNAVDNQDPLMSRINKSTWKYDVDGYPTIIGYFNGRPCSIYKSDGTNRYRTAPDLLEYAEHLGMREKPCEMSQADSS